MRKDNREQMLRIQQETIQGNLYANKNYKKSVNIECMVKQILKNQQEEIFKTHDLVIMYDGVSGFKVYEKGKDISKGITRIILTPDLTPIINYEKAIISNEEN